MKEFDLYVSDRKDKKFDIYVPKISNNKLIKCSFGASGYEDYTIHKDKERRRRYRIRHKNDKIDDPYSAGFWSWYVLWNYSNFDKSLKSAIKLAKKIIFSSSR